MDEVLFSNMEQKNQDNDNKQGNKMKVGAKRQIRSGGATGIRDECRCILTSCVFHFCFLIPRVVFGSYWILDQPSLKLAFCCDSVRPHVLSSSPLCKPDSV